MKTWKLKLFIFLVLGLAAYGTIFVVVLEPAPSWVDPNIIGQDTLEAISTITGVPITGGAVETEPGVLTVFEVLTSPPGMTWDVNDANAITYRWEPVTTGIFYARIRGQVIEPYPAGETYWTFAIRVREPIFPSVEWWHENR
jgi:hypothetical protein